ncbi:BZ3500_MvSof-1268-A1-R1_C054g00226 [Microbotryum saponariae]|uniref:BZ3500_MvSof-1268-A1-R1_C054g00226 protein n=1 Tax=Microbotryum saponariae TaxID=289078 RepID=A0A2X0L9K0_9BASI|nr:BZ3500_MvSof-1268-A1-R1_C054g00226 [Microbotryum saponariae]
MAETHRHVARHHRPVREDPSRANPPKSPPTHSPHPLQAAASSRPLNPASQNRKPCAATRSTHPQIGADGGTIDERIHRTCWGAGRGGSAAARPPLARTPGGESHSGIRDGPSSAVISSRWRGTLPDREGLWTGDHPERLVIFTAFGESYLSLLCDISTSDLFDTSRVIQLVATLFFQAVGRRWPDPGFADRVAQDFHGCRQSSSRAYDHVGEWRARYRAFVHDNDSFTLSPLQLATTFYQSLSDSSKREVRAGMLREYHDNSLVTIGRFGLKVPSIDEITEWAAIADDISPPPSVPTPPSRTATYGAIVKAPRVSPPATNTPTVDERFRSDELDGSTALLSGSNRTCGRTAPPGFPRRPAGYPPAWLASTADEAVISRSTAPRSVNPGRRPTLSGRCGRLG